MTFITVEGCEGAGKTTLIERLEQQIRSEGRSVLRTREPGGTKLGEEVRAILLQNGSIDPHAELCLFLASRAQHLKEVIQPALDAGTVVICDRFNDSTIAYQGAARNLGIDSVAFTCDFICQGVKPDLTLLLDVDPLAGLLRIQQRRTQDRIESEELRFHIKIREAYLALARKDPQRIYRIDASQSLDQVYEEGWKMVQQTLAKSPIVLG
jgi:dTMP kinase